MSEPRPPITDAQRTHLDADGVDPILRRLVEAVEDGGGSLPATLVVDGSILTGDIVGYAEWLEEFLTFWEPETRERLKVGLRHEVPGDGPVIGSDATMFHMLRAKTQMGLSLNPQPDGMSVRGRLAAVTGWSAGTLSPSSDDDEAAAH